MFFFVFSLRIHSVDYGLLLVGKNFDLSILAPIEIEIRGQKKRNFCCPVKSSGERERAIGRQENKFISLFDEKK